MTAKNRPFTQWAAEVCGGDMPKNLADNCCPFCGQPVKVAEFRDKLSCDEYAISGLCQTCQDVTFTQEDQ